MFGRLSRVPFENLVESRNAIATVAACRLISVTLTLDEILLESNSSFPEWKKLVEFGLKHRNTAVQGAAADAMSSFSKIVDCSQLVIR